MGCELRPTALDLYFVERRMDGDLMQAIEIVMRLIKIQGYRVPLFQLRRNELPKRNGKTLVRAQTATGWRRKSFSLRAVDSWKKLRWSD